MEDTSLTAHITVRKLDDGSSTGRTRRIVTLVPVEVMDPASPIPSRVGGGVAPVGDTFRHIVATRVDVLLFTLALSLYLITRFVGLLHYPLYFHGDEAIHTVYASELIRDGGMLEEKTFLPTYFKNGPKYNLSLSVYLQILPTWLFGKSVVVTRGASILMTLIPAAVVTLIVRDYLKLPYGWVATLLLSLTPAWFLHSRTAFETVLAVSMYAGFLYYYLRYRLENPKYLYVALTFGALTFYAYSPAQLIIVACAFILLILDFPYHLQHWKTGVGAAGWLVILSLPYLRFRMEVSAPIEEHLRDLGSYLLSTMTLSEKLSRFVSIYFYGLAPGYWYFPNLQDIPRHQMGPYTHILRVTLPFALIGVFIALRSVVTTSVVGGRLKSLLPARISQAIGNHTAISNPQISLAYRTLLIALLVSPLPGTLVQVGITRILTFIIPITILTAVGLISFLGWLETRWTFIRIPGFRPGVALVLFGALALGLGSFTNDVLRNAPTWVRDYGFGGMQYGAPQLFDKINGYLHDYTYPQIILSPNWANGSDALTEFFLDEPFIVSMANIDFFLIAKRSLETNHLIVLPPDEYERARLSNKFKAVEVIDRLLYPNGKAGFYFVQLTYADNFDQILAMEHEARLILQEATLTFDGMLASAHYSALDMGQINLAFDENDETLIRTDRNNPFILELILPETRDIHGLSINVGASNIRLTIQIFSEEGGEPLTLSQEVQTRIDAPVAAIDFGRTISAQKVRIEVLLLETNEFAHVHIWEIRFLKD